MTMATHLIKIWFYDSFPENYTPDMIAVATRERFSCLGDKLENVVVEPLMHFKILSRGDKEKSMIDKGNPRMEKLVKSHKMNGGKT